MSILIQAPPKTVVVDGAEYPIASDFRTSISFEILMGQPFEREEERIVEALKLYYGDRIPANIEQALDRIVWFYCGGEEEHSNRGSTKRCYSFEHDDKYIYAAFMDQYKIDLQKVSYMHWWDFRSLFMGLKEGSRFVEIMGYRTIKIDNKMPKEQKEFYKRMQRIFALPISEEEQKELDELNASLMEGRG